VRTPPATVGVWCVGMFAMAVALLIAHYDFELGFLQTVKSFIGWMKGWALLAIFPLIGATLSIRPLIVVRALSVLSLHTLALAPLFLMSEAVGLPQSLYISPLHVLASGPEFFDVTLYAIDDVTGKARWRFFSPWATAAAFLAGIGFIVAVYEKSLTYRIVGIASALAVFYMSGSRLSAVALPAVLILMVVGSTLINPRAWLVLAAVATLGVLLSHEVLSAIDTAVESFNNARAASSRVRAALGNIAVHRWMTEAPVFGHGILEPGGHVVERMMIGSHHTWWGLLYVKGAVGFVALAVPMTVTVAALVVRAQADRVARIGLGIVLSMILFSFADNLEVIAYQMWPALILLGIALARPVRNPLAPRLGAGIPESLASRTMAFATPARPL